MKHKECEYCAYWSFLGRCNVGYTLDPLEHVERDINDCLNEWWEEEGQYEFEGEAILPDGNVFQR